MNVTRFSDLEGKMDAGLQMAQAHNMKADAVYKATGQVLPRYDLVNVQSSILKAHRKFYGLTSKYSGKGALI